MGRPPKVIPDRWEEFHKHYDINEETECWEWNFLIFPNGYGRTWTGSGTGRAHRLAYELYFGEIPAGLFVCHECDNKRCVNPNHLFLGTNRDNQLDASAKGKLQAHWTDEKRKKYSEMHSGEKNNFYGRTGEAWPHYGKPGPATGMKHSEDAKKKIGASVRKFHLEKNR